MDELENEGSQPEASDNPDSLPEATQPDQGDPAIKPEEDSPPQKGPESDDDADSSPNDPDAEVLKKISDAVAKEGLAPKGHKESKEKSEGESKDEKAEGDKKDSEPEKEGEEDDLHAMPEGLAPKSQERFKALVSKNKEVQAKLDSIQQDYEQFQTTVKDAGINGQEFSHLMSYAKAVKTGNTDQAIQILQAELRDLQIQTGKKAPDVDILDGFPELQERVNNLDITLEDALTIAKAHKAESRMQQDRQAEQATQQQEEAFQQSVKDSAETVTRMEEQWRKNDIDYPAKSEKILAKISDITKSYHPSLWPQVVEGYYNILTEEMKGSRDSLNSTEPLKPSSSQAPARKPAEAESSLEAIKMALEQV